MGPRETRVAATAREAGAGVDVGVGELLLVVRPGRTFLRRRAAARARVPTAPRHGLVVVAPATVHDAEVAALIVFRVPARVPLVARLRAGAQVAVHRGPDVAPDVRAPAEATVRVEVVEVASAIVRPPVPKGVLLPSAATRTAAAVAGASEVAQVA